MKMRWEVQWFSPSWIWNQAIIRLGWWRVIHTRLLFAHMKCIMSIWWCPLGSPMLLLHFKPLWMTSFHHKFVLVFFHDILIHSPDSLSHICHLRLVFDALKNNAFWVDYKKCCFGVTQLECFGHIISAKGIAADPSKVAQCSSGRFRRIFREWGDFLDSWAITDALWRIMGWLLGHWPTYFKRPIIVSLSHNLALNSRTKHMKPDFHVQEKALAKTLTDHHIPASDQLANIRTQALSTLRFSKLCIKLSGWSLQPVHHPEFEVGS